MATIKDKYVLEIDTKGATDNINRTQGKLGGLGAAIGRLGPLAVAAGAALGGMAVVSGITETASAMDDLVKKAREVGAAANEADFTRYQNVKEFFDQGGVGAATFERGLRNLQREATKLATDGTGAMKNSIDELLPVLQDAEGNLLGPQDAIINLQKALNEGSISQVAFNDAMRAVGAVAGPAFAAAMGAAGESAGALETAIAGVSENAANFSLDAASNAEEFNDRLQDLGNNFTKVKQDLVSALLPALTTLAEGALTVIPPLIESVGAGLERLSPLFEALGSIISAFQPVGEALFGLLGQIFDIIMPIVDVALTGFVTGIELVAIALEAVIGAVTNFLTGLGDVKGMVAETTEAIINGFADMGEKILGFVTAPLDGIKGAFDDLWGYLWGGSVAKDIVETTKEGFDDMGTSMVGSVEGVASNIRNAFSNIYNSIRSGLSGAVNTASTGFKNAIGGIGSWFSDTFGEAGDTAEETREQLEDALSGGIDATQLQASANAMAELTETISNAGPGMETFASTSETINNTLTNQNEIVAELLENYQELMAIKTSLGELQADELDILTNINEGTASIIDLVENEVAKLDSKNESLTILNETMKENENITKSFYDVLATTFETMAKSIELDDAKAKSSDTFNIALEKSSDYLSVYAQAIEALISWSNALITDTNTLATAFNQMGNAADAAARSATAAIGQIEQQIKLANQANSISVPNFNNNSSSFFNPFAGFFADGGLIPSGKFGVVGEQGPELISGPANITPMDKVDFGGGTTNVTYNISAVDAKSFKALVSEDPGFIHAVAQYGGRQVPRRRT